VGRTHDFSRLFACQKPGGVCANALAAHFPNGQNGPPVLTVNVGAPGLNQTGDSLLMLPGQSIQGQVTAAKGTELYYLCALHPWMQGEIVVR
jgi:hypothetical protein